MSAALRANHKIVAWWVEKRVQQEAAAAPPTDKATKAAKK